jgi:hypothetical protein
MSGKELHAISKQIGNSARECKLARDQSVFESCLGGCFGAIGGLARAWARKMHLFTCVRAAID